MILFFKSTDKIQKRLYIGTSFNGRTREFGSRYCGSNPHVPATVISQIPEGEIIETLISDASQGIFISYNKSIESAVL